MTKQYFTMRTDERFEAALADGTKRLGINRTALVKVAVYRFLFGTAKPPKKRK